jgi:hypothetical protein
MTYDPEAVRAYFDVFADREWERLEKTDEHLDWPALLSGEDVGYTRPGSKEFHHPIALFTSVGLKTAITDAGLQVEALASANPILPQFLSVPKIGESTRATEALRALEVALCDCPGLVDAGGHLLAVARRPGRPT